MKDPLCPGMRAGQCWSQASCLFWCSVFWLHRLLPPPPLLPPQWTTLPPARVCGANCSFRAEEAGWENELRERRAQGGSGAQEAGRQAGAEGRRTIGNQRTPGRRAGLGDDAHRERAPWKSPVPSPAHRPLIVPGLLHPPGSGGPAWHRPQAIGEVTPDPPLDLCPRCKPRPSALARFCPGVYAQWSGGAPSLAPTSFISSSPAGPSNELLAPRAIVCTLG